MELTHRNRQQAGRLPGLDLMRGIANRIEARVGLQAWAAAPLSLGALALVTAAVGVFWDVAYHIDHGRDANLFSPAHILILLGLLGIGAAALLSILFATAERIEHGFHYGPFRVPFAALPMLAMASGAVLGFPLDDLWHRTYGIDVTEWSPTHLLMIGGAVFTTMALALYGAEAGAHRWTGRVLRFRRLVVFSSMILGVSVLNLEFDFGVPQWPAIFQPMLIALAAGLALTAARVALGRGAAIRAALVFIAMRSLLAWFVVGQGHTLPAFPLLLGSALCVEVAFLFAERLPGLARAVLGGVLIGTVGMAAEWAWNSFLYPFPWQASLLPRMWMPLLMAVAGSVIGLALGRVLAGDRRTLPEGVVGAAVLVIAALLAVPATRTTQPLTAHLEATPVGVQRAALDRYGMPSYEQDFNLAVSLDNPALARGADWFNVLAWQGGGRRVVKLREVGPGRYVSESPVPTGGSWKSFAFLAAGDRMLGVPIAFPADPQSGRPAIVPEQDSQRAFGPADRLLVSEAHGGAGWVASLAYAALLLVLITWILTLGLAGRRIARMDRDWREVDRVATSGDEERPRPILGA